MEMIDCNHEYTPLDKIPAGKDLDGETCIELWEYCSVVGMILYLVDSTRPYISFVVHQCAGFSRNPKRIHDVALKHIARYLKRTAYKGLILLP